MDSKDIERGFSTTGNIPPGYEMAEPVEEYDAFNDDTFGNDAETWTKEDHDQLVGAHTIEDDNGGGSDFFEFGVQEGLEDNDLLGGALEPEGEETAEANGGRAHYLLEEEIHADDLNDGSQDYSQDDLLETNGHGLSSKFVEKLNLKHKLDGDLSEFHSSAGVSQTGNVGQSQDLELRLNIGQGNVPTLSGINTSLQTNVIQERESQLQQSTAHVQGSTSTCPQHPNHFHHHGHHHQDLSTVQMAMPGNPMGTQSNTILSQQPTVIFAVAPPGHQMPIPSMTGFPTAPTMQIHSGVAPPVLAMHPGHQTFPPPLGHAQAIHIHNHPGQSQTLPSHLQGPNIHGFPPSIPPPQSSISSNIQQGRASVHTQQEFNDPAIMSVSKLPPPRPNLQQQGLHGNSLPTNIMDMNSRLNDAPHQHGANPTIPMSSNVKSVQDLEREMMEGPYARNANNSTQQANRFQQHNRNQGHLQYKVPFNGNNATRQMQPGFRNGPSNQHFGNFGGNNFNPRYGNHQGNFNRGNNSSGAVNSFDDKNRDTFGEDFVMDHQIQQQARQQRYHYGEREQNFRRGGNNLITPGHVHVLGILRGARENQVKCGAPVEPTGNPHLDMQQQRQQERIASGEIVLSNKEDEFSGLMTPRERQWIVNIQLNQLKCENPFLDDYYYTIFNQKRNSADQATKDNTTSEDVEGNETENNINTENAKESRRQRLEAEVSISSEDGMRGDSVVSKPQVKRSEEGAQLLLPAESTNAISNAGDGYTPKQFTNSLGCLQAVTVKAPRKIIDVKVKLDKQDSTTTSISNSNTQKDTKNFKQTLIELERLYSLLIEVEDCEKKLTALPTGTSMRLQVGKEREEAVKRIRAGPLTDAGRLKKYMMVRKGKALLVRTLRLLDEENMKVFCNTLFSLYALAARKDRDEQMLGLLWEAGLSRHLNSAGIGTNFEILYGYLRLICTGAPGLNSSTTGSRGNSKSPPPESTKSGIVCLNNLKSVLSTPLGVAVLATCIHRIALLVQSDDTLQKQEASLNAWFGQLAKELAECKEITNPGGIGLNFNEPFQLPQFLTSKQKDDFAKLLSAVKHVA